MCALCFYTAGESSEYTVEALIREESIEAEASGEKSSGTEDKGRSEEEVEEMEEVEEAADGSTALQTLHSEVWFRFV